MSKDTIFTRRLKELRGDRSQEEVAKGMGIARVSYRFYEIGDRHPDAEILVKIAQYYGVSLDYLVGISDTKTPDADIQAICRKTLLSEETVKTILSWTDGSRGHQLTHNIQIVNKLFEMRAIEELLHYIGTYISPIFIDDAQIYTRVNGEKQHCEVPNLHDASLSIKTLSGVEYFKLFTPETVRTVLLNRIQRVLDRIAATVNPDGSVLEGIKQSFSFVGWDS